MAIVAPIWQQVSPVSQPSNPAGPTQPSNPAGPTQPPAPGDWRWDYNNIYQQFGDRLLGTYDPYSFDNFFLDSVFLLHGDQFLPGRPPGEDPEAIRTRLRAEVGVVPYDVSEFKQSTAYAVRDYLAAVSSADDATVKALQQELISAGLLKSGEYLPGVPDQATLKGVEIAIRESQQSALPLDEAMERRKRAVAAFYNTESAASFAKPVFNRASDDEIDAFLTEMYSQAIGRKPKNAEMQGLRARYRAFEERAYANQVAAARYVHGVRTATEFGQPIPGAPTITGPESAAAAPSAFTAAVAPQVEATTEGLSHQVATVFDTFAQIIAGRGMAG